MFQVLGIIPSKSHFILKSFNAEEIGGVGRGRERVGEKNEEKGSVEKANWEERERERS